MELNIDMEQITTYFTTYGLQVIGALAIFIIGRWAAKLAKSALVKSLKKAKVDDILVSFVSNLAYALILAFVIIAVLGNLGVETTSIAAIFAAAGLAIGLALQGSLSNFAAGIMLVIFRPFKTGDFIEAAGTAGVVNEINIFTTTLKTGDNKTIIIPNSSVTGGNITNYSAEKTRRVDMVFGIGYGDDIKKAKTVLEKILKEEKRILKDPAPTVAVSELAESSVNFVVRPWVKTADYWGVFWDVTEKVKLAFDKEGISIPFPQRDLHVHNVAEIKKSRKAA